MTGSAECRLGDWRTALADVRCDAVITDPPYGARTHEGALQSSGDAAMDLSTERGGDGSARTAIDYACWTPEDVNAFVASWAPRTTCWISAMTSHDLIPAWEEAFEEAGMYAFAPIAAVIDGAGVRVLADGPANWTIHIVHARHRAKNLSGDGSSKIWRSLPGGYHGPRGVHQAGGRGKPSWLLDALVANYSNPGQVVADPFAGWGTTLVSARNAGRVAIGSERDPEAHAACLAYLSGDMALFRRLTSAGKSSRQDPKQASLFAAVEEAAAS